MSPAYPLRPRSTPYTGPSTNDTILNDPVELAGMIVAIVIAVGGGLGLGIYFLWKRRQTKKNTDHLGFAALSKGHDRKPSVETRMRREDDDMSRAQLLPSIVLPERSAPGKDEAPVQIVEHLVSPGPSPPRSPPRSPPPRSPPRDSLQLPRDSRRPRTRRHRSSGSVFVATSSSLRTSTYIASPTFDDTHRHKVQQAFTPALPDELAISVGERLAVVRGFGDGWCIVGREKRTAVGDIELGAVPMWVFTPPETGRVPQRPMRSLSVGVSVTLDAPGGPSFSWTNVR
ncbi:uncharacterized protein FIBRA_05227 [Fibroporia radiculosa]|uniref:SH3 domain-containing protein n=1 Tax=Fibroporia radiculosa TaxID=599839 RepID=J4HX61_9APHY|nr:uncharacterized protein FIBRA_05227 [Fibroporia radiculosa]CCM03107.1 predicted protein [Fibroporia radiculosa]